jgi:NADH-quinone oxidoreductase subunit H
MQPFADGLKAAVKQFIIPQQSNAFFFLLAPIISLSVSLIVVNSLLTWSLNSLTYDGELALLLLIGVSSIGIYGVIFSGWASNSKYAFLGALRSSAQMISYEVSLCLSIMPLIMCTGSLNLVDIVESQRAI